ncbi:MAG: beta-lactamase family protein [Ruminococcaceae bacterium]|nr:beta-lactamase family protein [Oscillospiraceae bacterium]
MDFSNIDRIITEAVDNHRLPSVSVVIGDADHVYYRRSYGYSRVFSDDAPCFDACPAAYPATAVPVTDKTLYDVASLTKMVSPTMIALRAIEEGYLSLSDTIGMFFDAPKDKQNISIRRLMTHTSGMEASFHLEDVDPDPDHALDVILHYPLKTPTGTKMEYSCMGYITLGCILEKVLGAPLDVLAKRYVFDPLGMTRTGYNPLSRGETDIACTEYDRATGKYWYGIVHDENARHRRGVSANAGIFSCLDDLTLFAQMLSRRGRGFLSSAMFEEAVRSQNTDLDEPKVLGHYLKNPGYFTTPEPRGLGFHLNAVGGGPAGELFAPGSYGHTGFTGTSLFVDNKTGLFMCSLTNRVHFTRACGAHTRMHHCLYNAALAAYTK